MSSGLIDGKLLEIQSVPLNRLEEMPITGSQFNSHVSDNTNPHGAILFQDELVVDEQVRITASGGILEFKNISNTDYAELNLKGVNLVGGTVNQISITELNLADTFVKLNSNFESGTPTENAGVKVIRGDLSDLALYWNESAKRWRVQQQDIYGNFAEYDLAHLGDVYTKIESDARFVNAVGDAMTGLLSIKPAGGDTNAQIIESLDPHGEIGLIFRNGANDSRIYSSNGVLNINPAVSSNFYKNLNFYSASGNNFLNLTLSDTVNPILSTNRSGIDFGNKIYAPGVDAQNQRVTSVANPVSNSDAVNLGFADTRYINATGDTMTGDLTLSAQVYMQQDFLNLNHGQADSNAGLQVTNSVSNGVLFFDGSTHTWSVGTASNYSEIITEQSLNNPENTQTIRDIIGAMLSSNTELGISVTYDGSKINFDVNDPMISLSGDVSGSAQILNLGTTNIVVTVIDDSHNHTAGTLIDFESNVKNIAGGMVSGNIENGISVTYDNITGKLNFDVNDFNIALSGDVSGSATVTNLSSVNINTTVADDSHNHTNLTGTSSITYKVGTGSNGIALKTASGMAYVRNEADTDYADLHVKSLYIHGTVTNVYSETVTINDNIILLNSNATGIPTENAGLEIERGDYENALLIFDEGSDRWFAGVANSIYQIARYDADLDEHIQDIIGGMVSGNEESGVTVYYDDSLGKLGFNVNDPFISLSGDVSGSAQMVNLGSVNIAVTVADDSHSHSASTLSDITETVQDIVGVMFASNTENGISATYDDSLGKINLDVNDFTITLSGDAGGSVAINNLTSASLSATIYNSEKVAGLYVHAGTNNEANKIVRSDANGYVHFGWLSTISGDNGTAAISRVYASSDNYLRYYTLGNFAEQVLIQGSSKNAHTHSISDISSGTLSVPYGGTGRSTLTTGYYLTGNGIGQVGMKSPATVLTEIGAAASNHTHTVVNGFTIRLFSGTFAGAGSYRSVSIPMFNSTYAVSIIPVGDTGGNLGEVYVVKYTGSFRVYNTGSATSSFEAIVIGQPG